MENNNCRNNRRLHRDRHSRIQLIQRAIQIPTITVIQIITTTITTTTTTTNNNISQTQLMETKEFVSTHKKVATKSVLAGFVATFIIIKVIKKLFSFKSKTCS